MVRLKEGDDPGTEPQSDMDQLPPETPPEEQQAKASKVQLTLLTLGDDKHIRLQLCVLLLCNLHVEHVSW